MQHVVKLTQVDIKSNSCKFHAESAPIMENLIDF